MAIQDEMERALEGGDTGSALDTMRLMEQERSTVGEPVAAVAAREQQLRQRQPLQAWDTPQPPREAPQAPVEAPTQETEAVDVTLPTGEVVEVIVPVGLSDEDIVSRLKAAGELPPDPSAGGPEPEKYRRGAALQGALIGTGDEWTAFLGALTAKALSALPGEQPGEDESFLDIRNDILESERYKLSEYRENYPVESTAIEVGGALAPALVSGGSTAPLTAARMVGTGAAWGGLYGAGAEDPDNELSAVEQIQERAKGAAKGAAVGAVTGGAIHGAAKGVGKINRSVKERKFNKKWNSGLEGRNAVVQDVDMAVTSKIAEGIPRLQAVRQTLKEKGIPASKARDMMLYNGKPFGWAKTPRQAQEEVLANVDVRNNTVILGSIPIVDKLIRPISTRIARHSERAAQMLRNYEAKTHFDYHDWSEAVAPWRHSLQKILKTNKDEYRTMTRHLYNGRFDEAKRIMSAYGGPKVLREFKVVEDILEQIRKDMKAVGIKDFDKGSYFPRVVKDLDGLKKAIGARNLKGFDAYLKRVKDPVRALQMYMKDSARKKERPLRSRKVSEITEEIDKYYMNLGASLDRHFKESTSLIRRRQFMGKHAKVDDKGVEDINKGIESLMDTFEDMSSEARTEVADLLKSRFNSGEKNMYGWLQSIRNIGHTALLANPVSAATQLADIGPTAWNYGLANTFMSTTKNLAGVGKKTFNAEDLGVMRQMVQELNEEGAAKTTKVLEWGLEKSGFRYMDKLGKDAIISASYNKASRMARSFHGKKQLAKDLKPAWGNETGQLIQDLASGNRTELVRLYLFTQLSKMQPISKSEMPQLYLDMPNGRILYQLLSWTIKQIDLMRDQTFRAAQKVYQENGVSRKSKASWDLAKSITAMGLYVGGMGIASDEAKRLISGKESAFQGVGDGSDLRDRVMQQMYKGLLKNYIGDHDLKRGLEKYTELGIPTGDVGFRILKKIYAAADEDLNPVERAKAWDEAKREGMTVVPIVGKLFAMWFMGGAEEFNLKERETRRKEYLEQFKH